MLKRESIAVVKELIQTFVVFAVFFLKLHWFKIFIGIFCPRITDIDISIFLLVYIRALEGTFAFEHYFITSSFPPTCFPWLSNLICLFENEILKKNLGFLSHLITKIRLFITRKLVFSAMAIC